MAALGWAKYRWATPVPCVTNCGRRIKHGVVHHADRKGTPARAMCMTCYRSIMGDPGPADPNAATFTELDAVILEHQAGTGPAPWNRTPTGNRPTVTVTAGQSAI